MGGGKIEVRQAKASAPYKGEAISRASKALSCFSPDRACWTLQELSAATGTPKETLRGILNTLVAHGMLRRDGDDAYWLGYAWLRLGALRRNQFDMRTVALPLMRNIRDAINETVILSVRVGDQRVHIDYIESTHQVRRLAQIGSSGPLHVGAAGVALLSTLPQGELVSYLGRMRASLAPSAYRKVERDLAAILKEGFAVAVGTVNAGTAAVAAAARLYAGESFSLAISCPAERFTQDMKRACSELVKDTVSQLSSKLGSRL